MLRWITTISISLMMAVSVSAQTLYIPASANVEGANMTRWRTDLQIKGKGGGAASFTLELLESREDNSEPLSATFSIVAGESLRLSNVIENEFGFEGTAALRITATDGFVMATSRTFNDAPTGTFGQTVPAVNEGDAIDDKSSTTLIQLSRSPDPSTGFRTNIGLVNLTGERLRTSTNLFFSDGIGIGTIEHNLMPYEFRQINDVFAVAGATEVTDGYAIVNTTSEDGRFIAYASVVDNGSGDAVFILGPLDSAAAPSADRLVVFESFMRPG